MTKTINDVIDFAMYAVEPEYGTVPQERVVKGISSDLEGRLRLTDAAGNAKEFGAGSTFVLPAGFKGTWETLEAIKKIYVIWQAKD